MKEKAAEVIAEMRSCHPCFCEQEGYPRPVPMSKIAAEGISTIWMSTGAASLKTIDFYRIRKQDYVFRRRGTVWH